MSQACRSLLVTGCHFKRAFSNPRLISLSFDAVDSLIMTGCSIEPMGPCLKIGSGVRQAAITGNAFQPSPYERIQDERGKDAEIIIQDNAGMEPTAKEKRRGLGGG